MVAVLGDNRRFLVFPLAELNEMNRGRGVRLQKYREGGLADVQVFVSANGLRIGDASGRIRTVSELDEYRGSRAQAGTAGLRGLPKNNRFGFLGFDET
jgi:topoisomerase-4 subunit A